MNLFAFTGRITADLELAHSKSGTAYTAFNLAVPRRVKKEGEPDADFIRMKAFGKTAEILCQYMGKGSMIGVTGYVQTGSYTDESGQRRYTTDFMANQVDFLESRKNGQQQASNGYSVQPNQYQQPQSQQYQPGPNQYQQYQYQQPNQELMEDLGISRDDFPF